MAINKDVFNNVQSFWCIEANILFMFAFHCHGRCKSVFRWVYRDYPAILYVVLSVYLIIYSVNTQLTMIGVKIWIKS